MISEILAAYAESVRGSIEHRAATVGASEIGGCLRRTFYAKHAERGPEHFDGWGAALRGTVMEQAFWVPALRARFGDHLKFAGDEQRQLKIGFISATPDALLVDAPADILAPLGAPDIDSDCLLLECKSLDPRVRLDEPKAEHTYQAVVQLGVMRETTEFKPRYAVITYINASFWDDVTEFVVAFDPAVYTSAKARAAKVLTAGAASELPPEGFIAGGHECERCPFSKACGIQRRAMPSATTAAADPQLVAEIRDLAIAYKSHQSEIDAAASKVREVQHEIRERLRAKRLHRVAGDDFSVTWVPVKGRQGFDVKTLSAAAAAAGVDVSEFESISDPTDRLDIRVRETPS